MMDLAANLSLYAQTPLTEAMRVTPSVATRFFSSKPFSDWKRGEESKLKAQSAVVNRLNEVIKGLGIVSKVIARR